MRRLECSSPCATLSQQSSVDRLPSDADSDWHRAEGRRSHACSIIVDRTPWRDACTPRECAGPGCSRD
jgi:hypothetical protein